MDFGNWTVSEKGISWKVKGFQQFDIVPGNIIDTRTDGEHVFYDQILLATNEDWLTQNDLYDLNYAFVYAIAKLGLEFNYEVFDATLAEQYELFESEEDDEDF